MIIEAARQLPDVKFKIAGSGKDIYTIETPGNIEFLGYLDGEKLNNFYKDARIQLMTSRCYEGFPTSLVNGMALGLPSIVPNHGAMPEIVEGAGMVFKPCDVNDLIESIEKLWYDEKLCGKFALSARNKYLGNYTEDRYHSKFMKICQKLNADKG